MIEEAFMEVFPGKSFSYDAKIRYSGRFKGYNANVQLNRFSKELIFNLSKNWRSVDKKIKIGLLQELMCSMFKKKTSTTSMDLYHIFIKQAHLAVPKTKTHPVLEESFNRINDAFFAGMMDQPNLQVSEGRRTVGHYDFGTDTVSISRHLLEHQDCMDYVMYHELLHKKFKFKNKNGRTFHHTSEFRKMEKAFPDSEKIEKKLSFVLNKKNKKKSSLLFFKRFFE